MIRSLEIPTNPIVVPYAVWKYAQLIRRYDVERGHVFTEHERREMTQLILNRLRSATLLPNGCIGLIIRPGHRMYARGFREAYEGLASSPEVVREGPWGLYAYDGELVYILERGSSLSPRSARRQSHPKGKRNEHTRRGYRRVEPPVSHSKPNADSWYVITVCFPFADAKEDLDAFVEAGIIPGVERPAPSQVRLAVPREDGPEASEGEDGPSLTGTED